MYGLFRGLLLRLLRAPEHPPEPPAGTPESVRVFRASKKFLTLQLVPLAISSLFVLFPMCIASAGLLAAPDVPAGAVACFALVPLFLVGVFGMRYFLIRLDWDMRYYIVTDRSLRIREGAMRIQEHTYTYANVQNLTIHQGPLERMLGIANVRVQTAGGGGAPLPAQGGAGAQMAMMHGGVLRGIEDAEKLRDQILSLLRAYRDAGLGDTPEHARRMPTPQAAGGEGLSPDALARLREVRDEVRALGEAL